MIRICDFHGKTVATSQNLRGVLTFARKHPVDVVTVAPMAGNTYTVKFYFQGGYSVETQWGDARVLADWLKARKSWSVERVTFLSEALYNTFVERIRGGMKGTVITWRVPK